MYKYEIIIYWTDEDCAYVAEVPELPGCMPTAAHTTRRWITQRMPLNYGSTRPGNLAIRYRNPKGDA
jgi:hypothetical protein